MNVRVELQKNAQGVKRVIGMVRWWWLIRARYYSVGIFLLSLPLWFAGGVLDPDGIPAAIFGTIAFILVVVAVLVYVVSLLAPIGVYLERKNLPQDSEEWYPSRWYYLVLFPDGLLGLILAYVYGRRRLEHYGNRPYAEISTSEDF